MMRVRPFILPSRKSARAPANDNVAQGERAKYQLFCGDALNVIRELPDESVDTVICDPPYGLTRYSKKFVGSLLAAWSMGEDASIDGRTGAMSHKWDGCVAQPSLWIEVRRVLKRGGNMFVFASARTEDMVSMPIRVAGLERVGALAWIYKTGFPLFADIGVGIDKALGVCSEVIPGTENRMVGDTRSGKLTRSVVEQASRDRIAHPQRKATSPQGKEASDFRAGMKRAHEPILCFRKPCKSLVQAQLEGGCGGLNIGVTRMPLDDKAAQDPNVVGRYPADVICDDEEFKPYFYSPKPSRKEATRFDSDGKKHSCAKPIDLMRWLVRLSGREGQTVLDPFMGSGPVGVAAILEGRNYIGIDIDENWVRATRNNIEGHLREEERKAA